MATQQTSIQPLSRASSTPIPVPSTARSAPPPAAPRPPPANSRPPAPAPKAAEPAAPLTTSKMPAAFERLHASRRPIDPFTLPDFSPVKPAEPTHDAPTVVRSVTLPPEEEDIDDIDLSLELDPNPRRRAEPEEPARRTTQQGAVDRTVIPAPQAGYGRLAGAMLLDLVLGLVVALAAVGSEMLLFAGHFPATKGGPLDMIAGWLNVYPHTVSRAVGVTLAFTLAYGAWGARRGRTLGRQATGLIALRNSGTPIGWPLAVWRAALSVLSLLCFGAGFFWVIVDSSHRSWHDVMSRSVVVKRRGR